MTTRQPTFGRVISEARKARGLSQKELAGRTTKDDGTAISAQYMNDIEHDRRNPPSDYILEQFAQILKFDEDYLYFLAGQLPSNLRADSYDPDRVEAAFKAFRRELRGGNK